MVVSFQRKAGSDVYEVMVGAVQQVAAVPSGTVFLHHNYGQKFISSILYATKEWNL